MVVYYSAGFVSVSCIASQHVFTVVFKSNSPFLEKTDDFGGLNSGSSHLARQLLLVDPAADPIPAWTAFIYIFFYLFIQERPGLDLQHQIENKLHIYNFLTNETI